MTRAAATQPVGGTVPATLALTLGAPATFGAFTPGVAQGLHGQHDGDRDLDRRRRDAHRRRPARTATGHLVNGAFSLPQPLQGLGDGQDVDRPDLQRRRHDHVHSRSTANDALRTGTYAKTLTFTLSTTNP